MYLRMAIRLSALCKQFATLSSRALLTAHVPVLCLSSIPLSLTADSVTLARRAFGLGETVSAQVS
jgi:hypothetical protein